MSLMTRHARYRRLERFITGLSGLTRQAAGVADPNQAPTLPSERDALLALSDQMRSLNESLRDLRAASPTYQYSAPITFGGLTTLAHGAYELASEFNTPCQYRVVCASFQGAGSLSLSQDQTATAPGLTTAIDPSTRQRSQVFTNAGAGTITGPDSSWFDLPAGGFLYLAVSITTNAGYVTVQFRRAVSHAGVYPEGQA